MGTAPVRHAPPAKARIRDRAVAEAIARAAASHTGPLSVSVEHRRQAPPPLFDLPSLQKTCGQRWGWTADKTLAVAQELYDGEGKKLITYPRAEARHLAENQIVDVPAIVAAMTRLHPGRQRGLPRVMGGHATGAVGILLYYTSAAQVVCTAASPMLTGQSITLLRSL
jgi:DNA topoisomerase IA